MLFGASGHYLHFPTLVFPFQMTIKAAITSALSSRPEAPLFQALDDEVHRIARAYLLQKTGRGSLHPALDLSPAELAVDCCAGLLQHNGAAAFPFEAYFGALGWTELDETDLFIAFRRMVVSHVNDALFRRYRNADAHLEELVRDLKEAVASDERLSLRQQESGWWLVVGHGEALLKPLPMVPVELLETYLATSTCPLHSLPQILSLFVAFTEADRSYCNGYPLAGLAYLARTVLNSRS